MSYKLTLAPLGVLGSLTNFPCELRRHFFLRPGGCGCTHCTPWLRLWLDETHRTQSATSSTWWRQCERRALTGRQPGGLDLDLCRQLDIRPVVDRSRRRCWRCSFRKTDWESYQQACWTFSVHAINAHSSHRRCIVLRHCTHTRTHHETPGHCLLRSAFGYRYSLLRQRSCAFPDKILYTRRDGHEAQ